MGTKLLSAHAQGEEICIWAEVDPDESRCDFRVLEVYATGEHFTYDESRKFLGTALLLNGRLVFHVFYLDRK